MLPLAPVLIGAGTQLVGGLLGQAAQAERDKRAQDQAALDKAMEMQMKGAQSMGQAQGQGLQALMEQYRSALQRPPVL